jgi:hypothetical protein
MRDFRLLFSVGKDESLDNKQERSASLQIFVYHYSTYFCYLIQDYLNSAFETVSANVLNIYQTTLTVKTNEFQNT